jgi:RNA polymerase sigma-70 factor, ECF subfamily
MLDEETAVRGRPSTIGPEQQNPVGLALSPALAPEQVVCYNQRIMDAPRPAGTVTRMLQRWTAGDPAAADELAPLIYNELRRLAAAYMRRERRSHTLQPTALVNEAYLRLVDQRQTEWRSREQFFRFSAHLMRQVLVDHARAHGAAKRGAGFERITLTRADLPSPAFDIDLLALNDALDRLAAFDERRARVLELRYFGGLSEQETAETLEISVATVRRDLRTAEAWLLKELAPSPSRAGRR